MNGPQTGTEDLFNRNRITVIKELTLVLVKTGHGLHVVIGQFKVEDIDVLGHPLLVNGLWNDRDAPLQEPTQDDLTIGLAVLGCNLGNRFVGEDVVLTFGEWCPGFNPDAFTLRKLNFLVLLVPRVNFDLVNSGLNGFRQFQVLYQTDYDALRELTRYTNFPFFTTNITDEHGPEDFHIGDRVTLPITDPTATMTFYASYLKDQRDQLQPLIKDFTANWPQ